MLLAALLVAAAPEFARHHAAGEALVRQGRLTAAIPHLEKARAADPGHYANSWDLAVAYLETGRIPQARGLIESMIARADKAELHNLLGAAEERAGRPVESAREYQTAAEREPTEKHAGDWGDYLIRYRAYEAGLKLYRSAAAMHPRSSRLRVGLGVALYSTGQYEEAATALCEAADLDPADPRPLDFLGGMIDVAPARNAAIAQRMARYAERFPKNARAHLYLAKAGGPEPERHLRLAAALDPSLAEAHLRLGILYDESGRDAEAITALERAAKADTRSEAAFYRLARLYRKAGRGEAARVAMEEYRRLHAAKQTAAPAAAPALIVR